VSTNRDVLLGNAEVADYSGNLDAWSVERIENFLIHLRSNIQPFAICQ